MSLEDEPQPGEEGESQPDATLPKVGDLLGGKYRLEKVVGEGGMGIVFSARHEALDQLFAIKVLLADAAKGPGVIERFMREAQAAARLQSEHVARVFDSGTVDDKIPFLVMEYLDGCDLEELLKVGGGALAISEACDYILQALAAMAQAHAVGIIHRDLKPANLFLALRPDGTNVIKILDFGISKQTASSGREKALTGRAVLGSPAYMPPEQLRNAKGVDTRADVWSLGIVLYELITGTPPFDGEGVGEIFAAILEKEPPSMRSKRADVPPELETVVLRALSRAPENRWQDVGEFAHALQPFCSGRWNNLVQTIDATLARSHQLRAMQTPSAFRVHARTVSEDDVTQDGPAPGAKSPIVEDSGGGSAKVAFTRTDQHVPPTVSDEDAPRTVRYTKKSRTWPLVALTSVAILGGAAFFARGYLRPRPMTPPAASPATFVAAMPPPSSVSPAPDVAAADPSPRSGAPALADGDAGIAAAAGGKSGVRRPNRGPAAPAASKSGRPKFLNSRE